MGRQQAGFPHGGNSVMETGCEAASSIRQWASTSASLGTHLLSPAAWVNYITSVPQFLHLHGGKMI